MSRSKTVNPPQKKSDETGVGQQPHTLTTVFCEKIREAAYYKWQAEGCPCGDGVEFWLQAEAELNSTSDNAAAVSEQS